jgi:hypothetical protein
MPSNETKLARGGVWLSIETGPRAWGRPALKRGGVPLEGRPTLERRVGVSSPRARRIWTGAAPYPSSGAEFCPRVGRLSDGSWVRGFCFVRVFRFVCVCFYEFKRVSPICLGDPHGCPRQYDVYSAWCR